MTLPTPPEPDSEAFEAVIVPRTRDLGDGFVVRRALPAPMRQMVGPFIFFDQMGPALLQAGRGLDVRPHPHIGLSTVTYLFEGAILHRDSLGSVQRIEPGALNWMTAGRGIVHSERSPDAERAAGHQVFGIQLWVALPKQAEESPPAFHHYGGSQLPRRNEEGVDLRLIAGRLDGLTSPAHTHSPLFYADVKLQPCAVLRLGAEYDERAAYLVEGELEMEHARVPAGSLVVFRPGEVLLRANTECRLLLLGGEPMDGPRHISWNFVSSSRERIQEAAADWKARRFPEVAGETEFIPLPEHLSAPVHYP